MKPEKYFYTIIDNFKKKLEMETDAARSSKSILFAKAALGIKIEDVEFEPLLERIYYRRDCTDFDINVLIRILILYSDKNVISKLMLDEIKEVILDYDYWFHKNNKRPGNQIIWTENHVFQFLTAELLATTLFPDDTFRMRELKGREIVNLIRPKIIDYIKIKGKTGFCEWNSNVYADENLHALINLYDFSYDEVVKSMSKDLLDIIFLQLAVNSYKGHFGCTHGRAYDRNVISSLNDNTGAVQLLAWDLGGNINSLGSVSGLAFATSGYIIPEMINRIALENNSVIETKEQQSFNVEDGPALGKGYDDEEDLVLYWHNMAYSHRLILKNNIAMEKKYNLWLNEWTYFEYRNMKRLEKEGKEIPRCRCSNYMSRVNSITYKTPDYMISCAQDFRSGEKGYQQHIWQATLADMAIVFTNHPGLGERPGYWAGNDIMPKALQYKNTLISMFDTSNTDHYTYTHGHFPINEFDQVKEENGWVFGRKGHGYIALFSQHGYEWADTTDTLKKELICQETKNIWLCQMGSATENGDFSSFVKVITSSQLDFKNNGIIFRTPKNELIETGYNSSLIVNGELIETSDYKRIKNNYSDSDYMSGKYTIKDGTDLIEIDFEKELYK